MEKGQGRTKGVAPIIRDTNGGAEPAPHTRRQAETELGEAYMTNGDKDLAIANYKKSLELNPQNSNAREMLKKLGQ